MDLAGVRSGGPLVLRAAQESVCQRHEWGTEDQRKNGRAGFEQTKLDVHSDSRDQCTEQRSAC